MLEFTTKRWQIKSLALSFEILEIWWAIWLICLLTAAPGYRVLGNVVTIVIFLLRYRSYVTKIMLIFVCRSQSLQQSLDGVSLHDSVSQKKRGPGSVHQRPNSRIRKEICYTKVLITEWQEKSSQKVTVVWAPGMYRIFYKLWYSIFIKIIKNGTKLKQMII